MSITIYDKAKYHYEGDFPKDLPPQQAFVHTGFYVAWAALNDLFSEEWRADCASEIAALRTRSALPTSLYRSLDGSFDSELLNDTGTDFTAEYFDFEDGRYLADYERLLAKNLPSIYHVEDSWANYDRIAARLDERFARWKRRNSR